MTYSFIHFQAVSSIQRWGGDCGTNVSRSSSHIQYGFHDHTLRHFKFVQKASQSSILGESLLLCMKFGVNTPFWKSLCFHVLTFKEVKWFRNQGWKNNWDRISSKGVFTPNLSVIRFCCRNSWIKKPLLVEIEVPQSLVRFTGCKDLSILYTVLVPKHLKI